MTDGAEQEEAGGSKNSRREPVKESENQTRAREATQDKGRCATWKERGDMRDLSVESASAWDSKGRRVNPPSHLSPRTACLGPVCAEGFFMTGSLTG